MLSYLPEHLSSPLRRAGMPYESMTELILRSERPVSIETVSGRFYAARAGYLTDRRDHHDLLNADRKSVEETILRLCNYSVYARQDELKNGYLTVDFGVRVGICGSAVINDGVVSHLKEISTLSFRVPREVIGCSDELLGLIHPMRGVLICGAPSSGKTTLIRDMARSLSEHYRVSMIDERGELSASRGGISGYDIGLSDVYLSIPKVEGILRAVRSLAPEIIVCDELGDTPEIKAIRYAIRCGTAFVATIHAASLDDLRARPAVSELLESGAFRYLVFLADRRHAGRISRIYEWNGFDA